MTIRLVTLTLVALLAPVLQGGQIRVPEQVPDLQQAIDQAQPGDTIRVNGGTWEDIRLDKPLTIVGTAGSGTTLLCTADGGLVYQALGLDGPGHGDVELVNLTITGGTINGGVWSLPFHGVRGGGFDSLRLVHCTVEAGSWVFPSGIGDGGLGLDVDVDLLVLADCVVAGGSGTDDTTGVDSWYLANAGDGVVTTGDVVVVDSEVRGGDGLVQLLTGSFPGCPPDVDAFLQGIAGAGLRAGGTVWRHGSVIAGGAGAQVTCQGTLYQKPAGVDLVAASSVALPGDLAGAGLLPLGGTWTASWTASGPTTFLVIGSPGTPEPLGTKGLLFLDQAQVSLLTIPGSGAVSLPLPVGGGPGTVGLTVAVQVFDPALGQLGNPVFATVVD